MLRQVSDQDLQISSITYPEFPRGYAIGDLLWAPIFKVKPDRIKAVISSSRYVRWESKRRFIAKQLPDSIVGRYCELHQSGDRCPQGSRLRQCIERYGRQIQNPYILSVAQEVENRKTLCVHMRCGDRGEEPMQTTLAAIEVLHSVFDSVIVLTGFHAIYNYYTDAEREKMMNQSLRYLRKVLRLSAKVRICLEGTADDHLFIMSKARHLQLSEGGFTALAGISAQGNVYVTQNINSNWIAELHPNVTIKRVDLTKRCLENKM